MDVLCDIFKEKGRRCNYLLTFFVKELEIFTNMMNLFNLEGK